MKEFNADPPEKCSAPIWESTLGLRGFLSGILVLAATLIISTFVTIQYRDFAARMEVEQWLAWVDEMKIREHIEGNRRNNLPLDAVTLDKDKFYALGGKLFEVTDAGMIIMLGGEKDQLVVLVPYFSERNDAVVWRCVGAPAERIPAAKCQFPPTDVSRANLERRNQSI